VQNQANEQWELERVTAKLKAKMHAAVDAVFNRWQSFAIGAEVGPAESAAAGEPVPPLPDFRTVALLIAIERVARATLIRGIWP
jgi:glutamate dehydrogenase (NAD(P)+)